jgi:NitT/TauT family transport system substrate-binding protein
MKHAFGVAMRAVRIAVAASLTLGLGASVANGVRAAEPEKLTIMMGGMTKLIYLPARLTEQLGYFKAEGPDVELLSQPAGVDAENELLAGAVQAVAGFYDHSIDLKAKGKEVKTIVVFGQVPGEVEMVASKAAGSIRSRSMRANSLRVSSR